jgi:malonate transporter
MSVVFYSVLPIFFIIVLGYSLKKLWVQSEIFWSSISTLAAFLFFPAQLFNLVANATLEYSGYSKMILSILIATTVICVILIFLQKKTKIEPKQYSTVLQGSLRYNSYVFIGVVSSMLGAQGLELIALISVFMITFVNVFIVIWHGVYCNQNNSSAQNFLTLAWALIKSVILNPLILSTLGGMIFNIQQIVIPIWIQNLLTAMANCAIGIGSLSIGGELNLKIKSAHLRYISLTAIIKLILFPIIMFIMLNIFRVTGIAASVAMIYSCAPISNGATAFVRQLGGDSELMSSTTTVVLILSALSMPILVECSRIFF